MSTKTKTSYIVGHYVQYYVSRDFHVDFTHNDLESAMSSWRHLCAELPAETDVEIQKQTTEVVVARRNIPDVNYDLERWRVMDQS
jgi:hypothetical protein